MLWVCYAWTPVRATPQIWSRSAPSGEDKPWFESTIKKKNSFFFPGPEMDVFFYSYEITNHLKLWNGKKVWLTLSLGL